MKKILYVLMTFLLFWASISGAEESFPARLDKEKVSLGETVTLSLILQEQISDPHVKPPVEGLPGCDVFYQGSKPTVTVQQGRVILGTEFLYQLVPKTEGMLKIPPVTFSFDGKNFRSNALRLEVVGASTPLLPEKEGGFSPGVLKRSPAPKEENPSIEEVKPKTFMEIKVSQERPFVRELFVVTHRIFCTVPFKVKEFKRPPGGKEFVQIEKLAGAKEVLEEEREIEGEHYVGKVISETVWFSKEEGERFNRVRDGLVG